MELTREDMFKKSKEKRETVQEMCREDASLWTKLRNEPYLREHPGMLAVSLIGSVILRYLLYLSLFMVFAYIWTAVMGAMEVL